MITFTFRRPVDPDVVEPARRLIEDVARVIEKVSVHPVTCRFAEAGEPKVLADTETERVYAIRNLAPFVRTALQAALAAASDERLFGAAS